MANFFIGVVFTGLIGIFCFLSGMLLERWVWLSKAHSKDNVWIWNDIKVQVSRLKD